MESTEQNEPPIEVDRASDADRLPDNSLPGDQETEDAREPPILQSLPYSPESGEETARRSGLAWSMGIVFFTSIAFGLFLGWIADILLGSNPWGIVGGIVLGAIIGFIQFFRISSQIYKKTDSPPSAKTLFKDEDGR